MTEQALHSIVHAPVAEGRAQIVHFTRHQLRLLTALGLQSGLMDKIHDLPLNFETQDEREKRTRENEERTRRALLADSFRMGINIVEILNEIDKKINQLQNSLDAELNRSTKNKERIVQIREDIHAFQEQKQILETIDDERVSSTSTSELRQVHTRFENFKTGFRDFMTRMRGRNRSSDFENSSDGVAVTDPPRAAVASPLSSSLDPLIFEDTEEEKPGADAKSKPDNE